MRKRFLRSISVREEVDDETDMPIPARDVFAITAVFKMGTGVSSWLFLLSTSHKKNPPHQLRCRGFRKVIRRRPTLTPSRPGSTIGAEELNCRVRNGNGCDLLAMATENRN